MKQSKLQVLLLENDYAAVTNLMDELIQIENIQSIYYGSNFWDGIKLLDDVLPDVIFMSLDLATQLRNDFLEKIEALSPHSKLILFSKKINPINLISDLEYSITATKSIGINLN